MRSKITLKELAGLLNVSVSTVSKALHNSSEIGPKTIQRVKELAALHNYRPNPTAVNLKSSKSGTIGVIIPNISNSFFARVLLGIEAQAQVSGLQVITYISNESLSREKQITELLSAGFVDGVLIAISEETQKKGDYDHLFHLLEYDIPMVLYDRIDINIKVDKVGVDDEKSFYEATKLLHDRKVEKIALASAIHHLGVGQRRIVGYRKALENAGVPVNDQHIITASKSIKLTEKIKELLITQKPGAVLCTDFVSSMLVSRAAYENNLRIPDDLKIIGFLTDDIAPFLSPSISYIEQNPEEIGREALNLLVTRIENKTPTDILEKTIKTKLIHLESTVF